MATFSEPCPSCGAPIALDDAWCRTCGSTRGVVESTPIETYLRSCVAALELLREAHRRVRPMPETRRAETDIETAIGRLLGGFGDGTAVEIPEHPAEKRAGSNARETVTKSAKTGRQGCKK
jgi:hypothetical protein